MSTGILNTNATRKGIVVVPEKSVFATAIHNDVGGTTYVPAGTYHVIVERAWSDYEIGGRGVGRLYMMNEIEKLTEVGTTGFAKTSGYKPERLYFPTGLFTAES
jgi:hypothetical protein